MLSTIFEVIGMLTVGALAAFLTLFAMGLVVLCTGDDDDGMSLFGVCWGWDNTDDEYL